MNERFKFSTDRFLRIVFMQNFFTCVISLLSVNINIVVDGILVGNKLGTDALAAISISTPVYLFLCVLGSFLVAGTSINASKEMARGSIDKAQLYYQCAVTVLFFVSIIITILGVLFSNPLVNLLCSDAGIRPYVKEYVVITIIGAMPKMLIYVPFWYLRLGGKLHVVNTMMIVMSVGNIILDIIFVYYMGMGLFGAGLASVIATAASAIIGFVALCKSDCIFKLKLFCFKDKKTWLQIIDTGIPQSLNNLLSVFRILIINFFLMKIGGGDEVAVFTVLNGIAGFSECIVLGVPQAAMPMLSIYHTDHDAEKTRSLIQLELVIGAIYSLIFLGVCIYLADFIQEIYMLNTSIFIPIVWFVLSIIPSLLLTVMIGYYNAINRNLFSNIIIVLRMVVMTTFGLILVLQLNWSTYSFFMIVEIGTIIIWLLWCEIYHKIKPELSRHLFIEKQYEDYQNIINFFVNSDDASLDDASKKIFDFCNENGISLEISDLIRHAIRDFLKKTRDINLELNKRIKLEDFYFNLRCYSVRNIFGLRIRYMGENINPFEELRGKLDLDEKSNSTIRDIVEITEYLRNLEVTTLQIVLKDVVAEENIRPMAESEATYIKKLTDEEIGINFYTEDYIRASLNNDKHNFFVYENSDKSIAAYFYIILETLKEGLDRLNIPIEQTGFSGEALEQNIMIFKSSVTAREYRGRNICDLFFQYLEKKYKNTGIKMIIADGIISPEGVAPTKKILENRDFKYVCTVEKPWKKIYAYCPYCKNDYCQCDGLFYVKRL